MAASWFPVGKNDEGGWRLDIVSLLAVIGESSMEEHAQTLTSSWTCILPRIIPAPQALLKPNRPSRMPQVNAVVVGVHSGTKVETLNYFPNIIHSIEDLPAYSFQVWEIKHKNRIETTSEEKPRAILEVNVDEHDPENGPGLQPSAPPGGLIRRVTKKFTGLSSKSKNSNGASQVEEKPKEKPHVPAAFYSPLNVLAVISCALTFGLLGWAIHEKDGTAILALATISLVSSMVGLASWWRPALMMRNAAVAVPRGDVVIRTREGAFIVVKCNEFVARELYTGSEECEYIIKRKSIYRGLVGIATFLLMVSVVLLGNCNWTMQAAIGSSYIVLNGAYWLTSLFEKKCFWDLKHYEYANITPKYAIEAHKDQGDGDEEKASYTRTLWYAIIETEKTGWVTKGGASPMTTEWDMWLKEAEAAAKDAARAAGKERGGPSWPAVRRKNVVIGTHTDPPQQHHRRQSHAPASPSTDKHEELPTTDQAEKQAKQQAPALTIPPQPTK